MAGIKIKSWEVSDKFWEKVQPLIPKPKRDKEKTYQRRRGAGRKPMDSRKVFCAIMFVLRMGIQWKALPKEFGSSSSVHAYFRKWAEVGFFLKLWRKGHAEHDEMAGMARKWQGVDGGMGKAPLARESVGPNPAGRGKMGTRRHVLVDAHGVPLSLVVTDANRRDVTQAEAVLASRVGKPRGRTTQNLCAGKGYESAGAKEIMRKYHYAPHIRSRGEEIVEKKEGRKPRRWIAEVARSWFNRFRKLLVRYEKTTASYEALLQMAAAVIIYRKIGVIYG